MRSVSAKNPPGSAGKANASMGMFPQALPISVRKLIDGVNISSIVVEYTKFGVQVIARRPDGSTVDLDDYLVSIKADKASRVNREVNEQLLVRIRDRSLKPTSLPSIDYSTEEREAYLASLPAPMRRILTMTNREFRAYKGTFNNGGSTAPANRVEPSSVQSPSETTED